MLMIIFLLALFIPSFDYNKHNYYQTRNKRSTFFRSNIPKDMKKCTLQLGYTAWPPYTINMKQKNESGIEGELIYMLAEQFNVKFTMESYSYYQGNMLHLIGILKFKNRTERIQKLYVSIFLMDNLK